MKQFKIKINAGSSEEVQIVGNYFRALTATDSFSIEFNNGVKTDFLAGLGMRVANFERVRIYSDTTQTITFIAGVGQVDDSRLAGRIDLSGALEMLQSGASGNNYGTKLVGTAATLILEENIGRRSYLLQNLGDVDVYIGTDSTVTVGSGIKVAPGGSYSAENTKVVYAVASTVGQDMRYSEDLN